MKRFVGLFGVVAAVVMLSAGALNAAELKRQPAVDDSTGSGSFILGGENGGTPATIDFDTSVTYGVGRLATLSIQGQWLPTAPDGASADSASGVAVVQVSNDDVTYFPVDSAVATSTTAVFKTIVLPPAAFWRLVTHTGAKIDSAGVTGTVTFWHTSE